MDIWQILSRGSDIVQIASAAVAVFIAAQANTLRRRYLFQLYVPEQLREINEYAQAIMRLLEAAPLPQVQLLNELGEIRTALVLLQKRLQFGQEKRRVKKLQKEIYHLLQQQELNVNDIHIIYRELRSITRQINSIHQDFQLR